MIDWLKKINIFFVILSFAISVIIVWAVFPLLLEKLESWNGEINDMVMELSCFKLRVKNFYFLLLLLFPMIFIALVCIFVFFSKRFTHINASNVSSFYRFRFNQFDFFLYVYSIAVLFPVFQFAYKNNYAGRDIVQYFVINTIHNKTFYISVLLIITISILLYIALKCFLIECRDCIETKDEEFFVISIFLLLFTITLYFSALFRGNDKFLSFLDLQTTYTPYYCIVLLLFYVLVQIKIFKDKSFVLVDFCKTFACYICFTIVIYLLIGNFVVAQIASSVLFFVFNLIYSKNGGIVAKNHFAKCIDFKNNATLFNTILILLMFPLFYNFLFDILFLFREHYKFAINVNFVKFLALFGFILFAYFFSRFVLRSHSLFAGSFIYYASLISITVFSYCFIRQHYIIDYKSYANVFELGNNTIAYETIQFGKMPFVDYFSAHALYDIIYQLIHFIIHRNELALFENPYFGFDSVIGYIILFLIIKELFDIKFAYLSILFLPFNITGFKNISFNMISVLMLIYIIKFASTRLYIVFWIITLLNAFYLYDSGVSLGLASIVSYVVFLIINKNYRDIILFALSGLFIGMVFFFIVFIYCHLNSIDFLKRIMEWKFVTLNSYDAIAEFNIGNYFSIQYIFSYFAFPAFAVFTIIYFVFRIFIKQINIASYVTLAFAIAQLLFVSRGLAFHNYAVIRGRDGVLFNYFSWTFIMVFVLLFDNNKINLKKVFVVFFTICVVIISYLMTFSFPNDTSSLITKAFTVIDDKVDIDKYIEYSQIDFSDESKKFYDSFDMVLSELLSDNESFLDFANITSLYAYSKRKVPMYIAQSPGLLSGIESQKLFVEECKNANLPLAIIGDKREGYIQSIYGINHNVRYYIVAEYIYSLYRPLVKVGDFAIWCLKSKYNDYYEILNRNRNYKLIDYCYDIDSNVYEYSHNYQMKYLPYIMGKFSTYGTMQVAEIPAKLNGYYYFNTLRDDSRPLFLSFEINNTSEEKNCSLLLECSNNPDNRITYNFNVLNGSNRYLFRISQDYLITCNNLIDSFRFDNVKLDDIINAKILIGDSDSI